MLHVAFFQHAAAGIAQDLFALSLRRDGQFKHEIESAQEGGIQCFDFVGKPEGWDGVFLEDAVDPSLAGLARAVPAKRPVPVVKDILHFIKDQQG